MSGQCPPEWEDEDDAAGIDGGGEPTPDDARQAEVAAYLAAVPPPVLPAGIEARISAAIAAESGRRAAGTARTDTPADTLADSPADSPGSADGGGARPLGPAPARARVRRRKRGAQERVDRWERRDRLSRRFLRIGGPLLAIVVVAGFAYLFTLSGSSSSSSSAGSAAAPVPGASSSSAAAAPEAGTAAGGSARSAAASGAAPSPAGAAYTVTKSGTKYQESTLRGQVAATEAALGEGRPFATQAQTPALAGCVQELAGGRAPRLVDRATYRGQPAYVIASSTHIWVVGAGCTAADRHVLASVPVAG